jgi:Homeodomain-like domain
MSRRVRRTKRRSYRTWKRRQRKAIALYHEGLAPPEIAQRLGVAPTTVWRYLRHTPKLQAARAVPHFWPDRRVPYWEFHKRGGCSEIVCGRKFCSVCGIWRHLSDFNPESRRGGVPYPRCQTCSRVSRNYYFAHETSEQTANRRERQRIFYEGQRRRNGVPVSTHRRKRVVDHAERVFFDPAPIVELLKRHRFEIGLVAKRAQLHDRTVRRILEGESAHIRIDVADKLAFALDTTLFELYGDAEVIRLPPGRRKAAA